MCVGKASSFACILFYLRGFWATLIYAIRLPHANVLAIHVTFQNIYYMYQYRNTLPVISIVVATWMNKQDGVPMIGLIPIIYSNYVLNNNHMCLLYEVIIASVFIVHMCMIWKFECNVYRFMMGWPISFCRPCFWIISWSICPDTINQCISFCSKTIHFYM